MNNSTPKVSLMDVMYIKPTTQECGVLVGNTEILELSGFPREIDVVSPRTGVVVRFCQVSYEDPWCDPDGWDGEMMVYRPVKACKNVGKLVLSHM